MRIRFIRFFLFLCLLTGITYAQNLFGGKSRVEAGLIAEEISVQPGKAFWLAISLQMEEGWHTYWRNPGDSGLETKIQWELPDGFTAGKIQWPAPEIIREEHLVTYGYHGMIYLLVQLTPPAELQTNQPVLVKARVSWLECADICVPGETNVSLSLPVKAETPELHPAYMETFATARTKLPLVSEEWQFQASIENNTIIIYAQPPDWMKSEIEKAVFFPYTTGLIKYAEEQEFSLSGNGYRLVVPLKEKAVTPDTLAGILFSESGWRGPESEKAIEVVIEPKENIVITGSGDALTSIWMAILFSFLGGIILNLMPCVLPVLSIKIMGIINQAHDNSARPWQHGWIFTLGVLVSFWVLAGILLILKAGGAHLGWGFQLQSPVFLILLSVFMFLFALSMFGVFEIGTSLTTVGGRTNGKHGFWGSFISGITATIVATPCTAPFMGSALGFALIQPVWISMIIFTFLGLGMAAPFVLISSIPALLKFIPKPGRWMESLKQFMGFLLAATVVWLLWVLGIQSGATLVTIVLFNLLFTALAAWIYGRWGHLAMPKKNRITAVSLALVILALSNGLTYANIDNFNQAPKDMHPQDDGIQWKTFTQQEVDLLVKDGKPVFIDFTAAWCLSCQVNEEVAFSSSEVQQAFKDLNIHAFKADWTSQDESITKALARFNRNSVPLYVLYKGNPDKEPVILPELITPGIIMDALKSIER
ncbi:MAG: thioredoxin family protein [Calditrichaceae bacterium]|nr:thioredoxin family protein [Calditrichaceae bacterium]